MGTVDVDEHVVYCHLGQGDGFTAIPITMPNAMCVSVNRIVMHECLSYWILGKYTKSTTNNATETKRKPSAQHVHNSTVTEKIYQEQMLFVHRQISKCLKDP